MKKWILIGLLTVSLTGVVGCSSSASDDINNDSEVVVYENGRNADESVVRLATTTSVDNTGVLQVLEADFEDKTDYELEYVAVGSGAAMQMGRDGEVDGLLVHSKDAEEELVNDGISLGRNPLMYNFFEIVGPEPLESTTYDDVINEIKEKKLFVSRGDQSGTHTKELAMWGDELPANYLETGKGMLDTLLVADEVGGYTLTDDATFISNADKFDLVECYKDEEHFKNTYSYHVINPELNDYINYEGSQAFLEYLLLPETQEIIANYGQEEYGKPLYTLTNE